MIFSFFSSLHTFFPKSCLFCQSFSQISKIKTKKDVLSRLNRRFLLLSKNTGQHPLRTADAWKELSWCGPGTAPVCPYPSAAFSQRPPLLRIFHRSCCLKLWRALPECTVLTGGHPSCRRRPPCLSQSGGLSPAETCQDIMLLAISFPGARIPP